MATRIGNTMSNALSKHYHAILETIGEDTTREGLVDTPERAARALEFLTQGYKQSLDDIVNGALFTAESDDMIVVKDIELYSLCEHHMLPFIGRCHIAYIPSDKILGLSKLARIVDHFAQRLQIQERLTKQIATSIMEITGAIGVAVVIDSAHLCMMMRGVQKQNSKMSTSCMLGDFRDDPAARNEFLSLLK